MIEYYITSISNLSCEMTEEIISNSSKFRIDKYNAINSKEVKKEILAATYLIDKHLRKYGLREKDMEYMIGKNGKPSFENHPEINFSISHSKDLVLVAFSDIEVGCDMQIVKNIDSNIFDKVLAIKVLPLPVGPNSKMFDFSNSTSVSFIRDRIL